MNYLASIEWYGLQWPLEKTQQVVCDSLINYGRLEWHCMGTHIEKVPNVAYEDVIHNIMSIWCVKGLIITHSNFMATWKVRPQMGIISWKSPHCAVILPRELYSCPCNWFVNLCQNKLTKARHPPLWVCIPLTTLKEKELAYTSIYVLHLTQKPENNMQHEDYFLYLN